MRSTVYLIFGSRAGLFDALGADLLQRGGFERMLRATTHPDAPEGLRGGIRGVVQMFAAHRDVLRALYSMAQLDADAVGGAVQRMEEGRAGGAAYRARRLAEHGLLRPDVTVDEAADLLWLLTSFDTFDLLYTGRALSVDKVAKRLTPWSAVCADEDPTGHPAVLSGPAVGSAFVSLSVRFASSTSRGADGADRRLLSSDQTGVLRNVASRHPASLQQRR